MDYEKEKIELRDFFLDDLRKNGYMESTLTNYRRRINQLLSYMYEHGITHYTAEIGQQFCDDYLRTHTVKSETQITLKLVLRRLNSFCSGGKYILLYTSSEASQLSRHFENAVKQYLDTYNAHGNKKSTLRSKNTFIRRFLENCIHSACCSFSDFNAASVVKSCLNISNRDSWAVIRDFLKFLCANGMLEKDFSTIVPVFKHPVVVPTTYTLEEIRKIESVIDRRTAGGKRDYAIFLLASRLGMRSGDIVNLTFDSIDFHRNEITFIQQKTENVQRMPLFSEIRMALEDYMAIRPTIDSRYLFIRSHAPYRTITTSVIRFHLTEYFRAAGIYIQTKKHGPHTLRASLTSSMLNDGIPYDAVRKVLGHTDENAIKHYAKLDIKILRKCAISVGFPAGFFKHFLEGGVIDE